MEPTNAEMIFWFVLLAVALIGLIFINFYPSAPGIEITWGQRRDWENRQRDYERRTR